jgi:hypothetical protein
MADDSTESEQALKALPAAPKKKHAAAIVRENRALLRERRDEGVSDDDLLAFVNSQARCPITLITLRCYLARDAGRVGVAVLTTLASRQAPRAGDMDIYRRMDRNDQVPLSRIESEKAPLEQSPRTEQRGLKQPIKPGPVE